MKNRRGKITQFHEGSLGKREMKQESPGQEVHAALGVGLADEVLHALDNGLVCLPALGHEMREIGVNQLTVVDKLTP